MSVVGSLKEINQYLENTWYELRGLIIALCLLNIFGFSLSTQYKDINWTVFIGIFLFLNLSIIIIWKLSNRFPIIPNGKIGFILSISCSDDTESIKLREDFIIPLKNLIYSGRVGQNFHFIELPQRVSRKIVEKNTQEEIEKIRKKCRAHFVIFGRVRYRKINGKDQHCIELDGMVTHANVEKRASDKLAGEFAELLPRKINIESENDMKGFEFTSQWTDIVSKYIIGIAAAFSGDLDGAENLYLDAQDKLIGKDERFPVYKKLFERIPIRISELYEVRANLAYITWCKTKNPKFIQIHGMALKKVEKNRQQLPSIINSRSVQAMLEGRNVGLAISILKKSRHQDATWNYNMAFLYCYSENLKLCIRHYRNAIREVVSPQTLEQIEDFYLYFLDQEPEKFQLYYGLGFFNWKAKGDTSRAIMDFEKFLSLAYKGKFATELELTSRWVKELKNTIKS
jgi:tetratricopeptide (TPR) repeat protein